MAFKYLNPGYVPISYGFSNNTSVRTIRSTTYNPRCGVALVSVTASSNIDCIIENAVTNDTNYLYIKFDIYLPADASTSTIYTDVVVKTNRILRIEQTDSSVKIIPLDNDNYALTGGGTNLKTGAINTVLLQVSTSSSSWSLTAYVNDGDYPIVEDLTNSSYSGTIETQSYRKCAVKAPCFSYGDETARKKLAKNKSFLYNSFGFIVHIGLGQRPLQETL